MYKVVETIQAVVVVLSNDIIFVAAHARDVKSVDDILRFQRADIDFECRGIPHVHNTGRGYSYRRIINRIVW